MKNITNTEFDFEVLASKQPVLVDFYTESCPPCRALAPVLQEWEQESANNLKFVKVDAATEQDLSVTYGVTVVPTLFLFSNGKVVAQTVGFKSKNALMQWAEEALRSVPA